MAEVTDRFVGPDGFFQPSVPHEKGKYSIGFLEELCEFIYYGNEPDEKKLKSILEMEGIIQEKLSSGSVLGLKITYIPTWSPKLQEKIKNAGVV